jgi:hypothetical protein
MAFNFPSSPANGATFEGYVYNSTSDVTATGTVQVFGYGA